MIRFVELFKAVGNVFVLNSFDLNDRQNRAMVQTESLEARCMFAVHNDSFDITQLTQLRSDPQFSSITGQGIGIAILDTGVDAANPDLTSKVVAYYNAVENAIPASITSASVANATDNEGHGTHTSGIAASADQNIGVAYGASLIDVKVLADSGEKQISGDPLLRGLQFVQQFANQFNIKVVSMSIGESNSSGGLNLNSTPAADDISREIGTLESLGITVVSAAGNSYANDPAPGESYPAVVSTISVGSTWSDSGNATSFGGYAYGSANDTWAAVEKSAQADQFSATSQRSTLANQVVAPGVDIYSDWNGTSSDNSGNDLLHNTLSGTSMATPFVSGLVALMQNAAHTYGGRYITNPTQVLSIIKATADVIQDPTLSTSVNGRVPISNGGLVSSTVQTLPGTGDSYYRVNVYKAIQAVKALFTGTVSNADTDNLTTSATTVPNINGTSIFTETGSIGTDGLNQVGNNDVDLYQAVLDSPGTLTIAASAQSNGTAFIAALRLFDSNGNQIATVSGNSSSGYPILTAGDQTTPLQPGTYFVGISSVGNISYNVVDGTGKTGGTNAGDYNLSFSLSNPDPNGVTQGALSVDMTNPTDIYTGINQYDGTLGSDPPPTGSTTRVSVPNGDVDMFKIIAPDTGNISATANATQVLNGADTYIRVFDSNLNEIAANGVSSNFPSDSSVNFNVTVGGTYYVSVTVYSNRAFDATNPFNRLAGSTSSQTNYVLTLKFNNGNSDGTALLANQETIGQTITGVIGSTNPLLGSNGGSKYVDWYYYHSTSDGLLDLAATSPTSSYTPTLQLWQLSSDSSSISQIGAISGSGSHLIYEIAAGETVYVSTTGQGNSNFNWFALGSGSGGQTGSYSLSSTLRSLSDLKTLSDSSVQNGTPQTITAGQVVNGNLGMYNGLIVGDTAVDLYKFVPAVSGNYDLKTDTSQEGSADTVVRLFDSNGNQIAINDNSSSATTASFIRAALIAGTTYYIGVSGSGNSAYDPLTGTGAASGSTGNYIFTVASATIPAISVANAPTVQQPSAGQVASAVFTVSLDTASTTAVTVNYATGDGTAIAGTDYTATSGTLTFPAGVTTQTVSVPILSNPASATDASFSLSLSSPSSNSILGDSQATATITSLPVTTHSFGPKANAVFADAAGKVVTVKLAGAGTGEVTVIGSGASESVEIAVNDSTAKSKLSISVAGAVATTIAGLQINGSLAALLAPRVDLEGDLSVAGTIATAQLKSVGGGHTISIAGSGPSASLSLGGVSDVILTSMEAINVLSVSSWTSTTGSDSITAPSIRQLKSTGNFAPSLTLTSSDAVLNSAIIGQQVSGGTWSIAGAISSFKARGSAAGWQANIAGALGNVTFTADASGSLIAQSIGTFKAPSLSQATIETTGTLATPGIRSIIVKGTATGDTIRSATGNINTARFGALIDSTVFAGVDSAIATQPTALTDFTQAASILNFAVTGVPGGTFAVSNSILAAETIGKINVKKVNPASPFAVTAHSIAAFVDAPSVHWNSKQSQDILTGDADLNVKFV